VSKHPRDFEDDIPLGHAIFLLRERGKGAEIIPELMSFQIDGKLYNVEKLAADFFDEELLGVLDRLRMFLRDKEEETLP
jgi:hypothetical protein